MTLTFADLTVIGVMFSILVFLGSIWIKIRLETSIKHEYDKKLEQVKFENRKREQAARVAKLLAMSSDPNENILAFNELAWELSLWLPKDMVWELTRCLCNAQGAKHPKEILIAIRTILNGGVDDGLEAGQIVHREILASHLNL